ncbi:hypothetical protein Tdes44962_MAKER01960 [Teratosphaeria destructans]|uniref:Uncharacterized protein n=1 Tax=Teratosphaeria destructans TaxID=418781 RepID=A0A9W7SW92_9PEZI|nr:hypothetical protein Tdes44962_MAKER01960 [Teratosphaeria destructans]
MKSWALAIPLYASLAFSTTCDRLPRDDSNQDIPAGYCQPTLEEWHAGAAGRTARPTTLARRSGTGASWARSGFRS